MLYYRNINIRSIFKILWMSKVYRLKGIYFKLYIIVIFIFKYLERFNFKKKVFVYYGVFIWLVLYIVVFCLLFFRDFCLMDDLIIFKF